jgi:hypothetical protein
MRRVMWTLACAIAFCGPAAAVPARAPDLSTTDEVLRWINGYRAKPDVVRVPAAVRTLSQLGALRDAKRTGRVRYTLRSGRGAWVRGVELLDEGLACRRRHVRADRDDRAERAARQ